jgi:hypothetical protein
MGDRADRPGMAEAWDDPTVHDAKIVPLAFTPALAA